MKKEYGYILIAYILMQLSSFIGVPLVYRIGIRAGQDPVFMRQAAPGYWIVISFSITLIIILLILRKARTDALLVRKAPASPGESIVWAIAGVFLALFAQGIAANIEANLFGVDPGSKNTENILQIIKTFPASMLVSSIFGPILEEIVFRKIIFGSLYKRFSFWIAATISSVIFAMAHMEFEHILLYSAMGFTFAFLYVRTGRILVPIFAHVAMNTLVVVVQLFYRDQLQHIQGLIGGFFQ
ncbi:MULTISPECIES: CPBP family intramembrane glutamic endopeptidase [Bacillus]|uniref:CPBP family intramembrane glutamic endopeptidase n=1 Tax=Bacillus TaxID=1386 RepID=UPI00065DF5EA|nr:CPBP family intramembrane glutamic endopeptidase [Bacillus smithii]AKP48644.1 CAAX amino terminal protease family protein [Bacillus smithii]MED0660020.1 CPBP family intramembrane metalloprotease [Bacillus smithii]MED4884719.1 CPBP family intramembrane metalloprotease [Bacillus smithii]MED4928785.1 CPBP family intramembrane metalloprotease [Bacillus smithii]